MPKNSCHAAEPSDCGVGNNTFGDPNKTGNKEVWDLADWNALDKNDWIGRLWSGDKNKPQYDTQYSKYGDTSFYKNGRLYKSHKK